MYHYQREFRNEELLKELANKSARCTSNFMRNTKRESSAIWNTFKVICDSNRDLFGKYERTNYMKCCYDTDCNKIYKYKCSTTTLQGHINKIHANEQLKITFKAPKQFKVSPQHQKAITESCIDAVCVDLNNFNVLNKDGMNALLLRIWNMGATYKKLLNGKQFKGVIPTTNTITTSIVTEAEKITKFIRSKIERILATQYPPPISLATDMWANPLQHTEIFGLILFHVDGSDDLSTAEYIGMGD